MWHGGDVVEASDRDDVSLLEAWRDGDTKAGNELYKRHFAAVLRFLQTKVDGNLEDLLQRTFLGCLEGLDRIRDVRRFRTYLLAVARNQLLLHYRAQARGRKLPVALASVRDLGGGHTPSGVVGRREEERILLTALRRLPLDHQTALELYYWEELPVAEIAVVLDVAPGTIKSRLARARDSLRDLIVAIEADPDARQRTLTDLDRWAENLRDALEEADRTGRGSRAKDHSG
jgi:RNA polymerase sigma-70 factor (ECF subfamily)